MICQACGTRFLTQVAIAGDTDSVSVQWCENCGAIRLVGDDVDVSRRPMITHGAHVLVGPHGEIVR